MTSSESQTVAHHDDKSPGVPISSGDVTSSTVSTENLSSPLPPTQSTQLDGSSTSKSGYPTQPDSAIHETRISNVEPLKNYSSKCQSHEKHDAERTEMDCSEVMKHGKQNAELGSNKSLFLEHHDKLQRISKGNDEYHRMNNNIESQETDAYAKVNDEMNDVNEFDSKINAFEYYGDILSSAMIGGGSSDEFIDREAPSLTKSLTSITDSIGQKINQSNGSELIQGVTKTTIEERKTSIHEEQPYISNDYVRNKTDKEVSLSNVSNKNDEASKIENKEVREVKIQNSMEKEHKDSGTLTSDVKPTDQNTQLFETFAPFIKPIDTSLEDARDRLRIALDQTRVLREAFGNRVYEKYRVVLRQVEKSVDEIIDPIKSDPLRVLDRIKLQMQQIREEKEYEKKEAMSLNTKAPLFSTLSQSLDMQGLSGVENADQLSWFGAGLYLVILPEEDVDVNNLLSRGITNRGPIDSRTGLRVGGISSAAAAAANAMLERVRQGAKIRASRKRKNPSNSDDKIIETLFISKKPALESKPSDQNEEKHNDKTSCQPVLEDQTSNQSMPKIKKNSSPQIHCKQLNKNPKSKKARRHKTRITGLPNLSPWAEIKYYDQKISAATAALIACDVGNSFQSFHPTKKVSSKRARHKNASHTLLKTESNDSLQHFEKSNRIVDTQMEKEKFQYGLSTSLPRFLAPKERGNIDHLKNISHEPCKFTAQHAVHDIMQQFLDTEVKKSNESSSPEDTYCQSMELRKKRKLEESKELIVRKGVKKIDLFKRLNALSHTMISSDNQKNDGIKLSSNGESTLGEQHRTSITEQRIIDPFLALSVLVSVGHLSSSSTFLQNNQKNLQDNLEDDVMEKIRRHGSNITQQKLSNPLEIREKALSESFYLNLVQDMNNVKQSPFDLGKEQKQLYTACCKDSKYNSFENASYIPILRGGGGDSSDGSNTCSDDDYIGSQQDDTEYRKEAGTKNPLISKTSFASSDISSIPQSNILPLSKQSLLRRAGLFQPSVKLEELQKIGASYALLTRTDSPGTSPGLNVFSSQPQSGSGVGVFSTSTRIQNDGTYANHSAGNVDCKGFNFVNPNTQAGHQLHLASNALQHNTPTLHLPTSHLLHANHEMNNFFRSDLHQSQCTPGFNQQQTPDWAALGAASILPTPQALNAAALGLTSQQAAMLTLSVRQRAAQALASCDHHAAAMHTQTQVSAAHHNPSTATLGLTSLTSQQTTPFLRAQNKPFNNQSSLPSHLIPFNTCSNPSVVSLGQSSSIIPMPLVRHAGMFDLTFDHKQAKGTKNPILLQADSFNKHNKSSTIKQKLTSSDSQDPSMSQESKGRNPLLSSSETSSHTQETATKSTESLSVESSKTSKDPVHSEFGKDKVEHSDSSQEKKDENLESTFSHENDKSSTISSKPSHQPFSKPLISKSFEERLEPSVSERMTPLESLRYKSSYDERIKECSDSLGLENNESSQQRLMSKTPNTSCLQFFIPQIPPEISSFEGKNIQEGLFHLSIVGKSSFYDDDSHERYLVALRTKENISFLLEYLLAVGAAVPIPKSMIYIPLKEKLNFPPLKAVLSNLGNSIGPLSAPKDILSAIITIWLWSNYKDCFESAFAKNGRIDVDPECKWLVQVAVNLVSEALLSKSFTSAPFKQSIDRNTSRKKTGRTVRENSNVNCHQGNAFAAYTASFINQMLSQYVIINPEMDSVLPNIDSLVRHLDDLRMFALQARCQEQSLLASLMARWTNMSEYFSHVYTSSMVRAGEALGFESLCDIVQDEITMTSTLLPFDILSDSSGSWEDPCRPQSGFIHGLTAGELKRKAHARALIKNSLQIMQQVKGKICKASPLLSSQDESGFPGASGGNGGEPRTKATPISRSLSGVKRKLSSSGSYFDISGVPHRVSSSGAMTLLNPSHFSSSLSWNNDLIENMPYGRHDQILRESFSSDLNINLLGMFSNIEKSKKNRINSKARKHNWQRSTKELEWTHVATLFGSAQIGGAIEKNSLKSKSKQINFEPAIMGSNIFAPFCRKMNDSFLLYDSDSDSTSDEDIEDEVRLKKHQVVLDGMKQKLDDIMILRQQTPGKSRNKSGSSRF